MTDAFSSIPIIDFSSLQNPSTKHETLAQLREAIFRVGFLYLTNHGLEVRLHSQTLLQELTRLGLGQTCTRYSARSVRLVGRGKG